MIVRSLCAGIALLGFLGACSRGPEPPQPTEDLRPSVAGVIVSSGAEPPFTLESGDTFDPPQDANVRRIRNWPTDSADQGLEPAPGSLLLGGQDNRGWWFAIAGPAGPNEDGCWLLQGGSFDEGDTVRFSSGVRVPKRADFAIRTHGHEGVAAFPGHQDDNVCLDEKGNAVYFDLSVGI